MTWEPLIAVSARAHGVDDEDLLHAYRNAIDIWDLGDEFFTLIGPGRSGALLEVGVIRKEDGSFVVIHGMKCRRKYLR